MDYSGRFESKTIVLIEDEPAHAMLYTHHLITAGFNVFHVLSTEDMLQKMEGLEYVALIIVSLELDIGSDTDWCRLIHDYFPAVPMMMTTTVDNKCMAQCCVVDACLIKPFSLTTFVKYVQEVTSC